MSSDEAANVTDLEKASRLDDLIKEAARIFWVASMDWRFHG